MMATTLSQHFSGLLVEVTNSGSVSKSRRSSPPSGVERWAREPITLLKRDGYSRFVLFDGKKEAYIEPHFLKVSDSPGRDPDFDALVQARWYEYLAEGYLKSTGSKMSAMSAKAEETRINTPVQLYLAYRRLERAQLETKIYDRLLKKELNPLLRQYFDDLTQQSLPPGGVFTQSSVVSRI